MTSAITIKTAIEAQDLEFIHRFITNTYWAKGRSKETMKLCMDHSLNYGVFIDEKQIGYARVVSDFGQFAYIMDVFIDEAHRGKGYSKVLINYLLHDERLQQVKLWRLATSDAHGLYKQFGFSALAHPEKMMELWVTKD